MFLSVKLILLLLIYPAFLQASNSLEDCKENYQKHVWDTALGSCEVALKDPLNSDSEPLILDHLAHINENLGRDQQVSHYDKLIKQHPAFDTDFELQYNWYRRKGKQRFFAKKYDQSYEYFQTALSIAVDEKSLNWQSKSHNDLGVLLNQQGFFSESLSQYQQSLAVKLKLDDHLIIANTQYNVGAILLKLERPNDAIDYLNQAIKSYQKHLSLHPHVDANSLQQNIDHVNEDLVVGYLQLNQADKAAQFIDAIIQSKSSSADNSSQVSGEHASTNLALARFYTAENKPQLAQALLDRATALAPDENTLSVLHESAKIKVLTQEATSAIELAKQGLQEAKHQNNLSYQANFNLLISQLLETDKPQMALAYYKDYYQAREAFLAKKYDQDIDTINFKIKSNQIERDLFEQQLLNTKKENKIIELTNWVLISLIGLIVLFIFLGYYYLKKNNEKKTLLESIEFHKNQWLLLNANQEQQKSTTAKASTKQLLKEKLVKSMVEAVDVWNRHNGRNRLDLAEKSKVWTITNDNGVLRTRSMDKYLSIQHIPENPRWRKVVRTCHFILADSTLSTIDRNLLSENLAAVMDLIKGLSDSPS